MVGDDAAVAADGDATVVFQPGVGAFDFPAAAVAAKFAAVFVRAVVAVGRNEIDAALGEAITKSIVVVTLVRDDRSIVVYRGFVRIACICITLMRF